MSLISRRFYCFKQKISGYLYLRAIYLPCFKYLSTYGWHGYRCSPLTILILSRRTEMKDLRWMLACAFLILVCFVVYITRSLVLPIIVSMFFALLLNPIVNYLNRFAVPRSLSSVLTVLTLVIALGLTFSLLVSPMDKWVKQVSKISEDISQKIDEVAKPLTGEAEQKWYQLSKDRGEPMSQKIKSQVSVAFMQVATNFTPVVLFQALTVIVLTFFFLTHGQSLYRNVVATLPTFRHRRIFVTIGKSIQSDVSYYVLIISVINTGLGLSVAGALYLLGVEDALLWGAFAGIFNFVPYLGLFVVGVIITGVGFIQFGDNWQALYPVMAFLFLNGIESQVVTPTVLGQRFQINPLIVILWLFVFGWLLGVVGMILAVPILVSCKIASAHVPSLRNCQKLLS
ncbi:AI-2E family transporter [Teredinibacter turnerae]|uniref:AI-2E family transporter n=2 Tax=Teredinibacter turnerae TaxID=2426 RepID=UPI0003A7CD40|nr:AI-2E family transporter [Teredinibacter turnerae]